LKLFEYMAAGKPIVASDLPAFREVVRDNEHASLVEPGKPDALARGIRRVLDDMALAERIARHAFEQAPAYSWARRAERLEALLNAVAGGEAGDPRSGDLS
jgi:glycosyltransferase involved in cell wall biosynthesis